MNKNKLVQFLYTIIRDDITPGAIENIMKNHIVYDGKDIVYSNQYLKQYAEDIASRLIDE